LASRLTRRQTTDADFSQVTRNAELLLDTLQHYRAEGLYKLHAFVVMPDHVHLLLTPTVQTISQVMNRIKGGFSHRPASKLPIWQRGFTDHLVRNADEFASLRFYIHQNPVEGHLAQTAEHYPFSSAYRNEG
jgi:putative transposase